MYNQDGVDISNDIANSGVGAVPPLDPTGGWEGEATMDVEWAHAMAPGAQIDLIETNDSSDSFAASSPARPLLPSCLGSPWCR